MLVKVRDIFELASLVRIRWSSGGDDGNDDIDDDDNDNHEEDRAPPNIFKH